MIGDIWRNTGDDMNELFQLEYLYYKLQIMTDSFGG
jgi:hypothetical protein